MPEPSPRCVRRDDPEQRHESYCGRYLQGIPAWVGAGKAIEGGMDGSIGELVCRLCVSIIYGALRRRQSSRQGV